MAEQFGLILKEWRGKRRMSQLDLGLTANVSARHISFLETGRSKPSKSMVMMLSDVLDMPNAIRNSFLGTAGFAPAYQNRALDNEDLAYVREAVNWTLDRHDPYPAFALDRHWNIVKANKSANVMLSGAGVTEGDSLLEALLDKEGISNALENWEEVMHNFIIRLRTESNHLGGDPVLDKAIESMAARLGNAPLINEGNASAVISAHYRFGETTLSLFSTISSFGSAEDIALSELKIEMMFPSDEATRQAFLAMTST
ncbi:helix-turn-helix domain-containing protein [Lentilitoribacter sp. EG35]|uniref:MmyB family transcriptional regulator n=1 Tax=Lentilitoribacter sp. EG35 TaxID=3234192 RepID=UPI0034612CF3